MLYPLSRHVRHVAVPSPSVLYSRYRAPPPLTKFPKFVRRDHGHARRSSSFSSSGRLTLATALTVFSMCSTSTTKRRDGAGGAVDLAGVDVDLEGDAARRVLVVDVPQLDDADDDQVDV